MKTTIKDLEIDLRPRERLKKYGVSSLGNDELLAILISTGSKDLSCKDLAINLINKIKKINNLENITIKELTSIKGIGEAKAKAIIEYRNKNKFNSIDDIKNVDGIGENLFDNIKESITV